ncbi:FHS family L-fucose permease-like MFS transporter [Pseudoalteromonas sp. MBR-15]|jgi:FHS family L-fucose permease-like MFS transporter
MPTQSAIVSRQMLWPFILLATCFAAWGTAANMTDPLVKVFSKTFSMSALQSALVQFSYYGAYFCLALPAALINRRFNYKTGLLFGLAMAACGALLFYPASQTMLYSHFLLALFILAGGLSILETSANPYVMQLGCEKSATRRLNLAQAFNPVGTNIGVFLAATLILPSLNQADNAHRALMSESQLKAIVSSELSAVMVPYVGMAGCLILLWLCIFFSKSPKTITHSHTPSRNLTSAFKTLYQNKHYRFGVVAQFFNVGAQTCVWTYTIGYTMEALTTNEVTGGQVLQYSMLVFLISRFIMTWLMRFLSGAKLLRIMALVAAALCVLVITQVNLLGVVALVSISGCLSLMFPTIYGTALEGLGDDAKIGAAGLVMAILGGAFLPLLQATLIDTLDTASSFIIPLLCFLIVSLYGHHTRGTKNTRKHE